MVTLQCRISGGTNATKRTHWLVRIPSCSEQLQLAVTSGDDQRPDALGGEGIEPIFAGHHDHDAYRLKSRLASRAKCAWLSASPSAIPCSSRNMNARVVACTPKAAACVSSGAASWTRATATPNRFKASPEATRFS